LSTFTPGPWSVHRLDRRAVVGADGDSAIADVHTWRDTDDASLIAAAPGLLEALRRARAEIGYFRRHAPGVLPVGHELVAMDTMQMIDAAIAKAEGAA
jgi:hypothetical protein